MAKMFRKRSKSEVQTEYTCSVRFLDDEPMHFTFKKDTIGQWLIDRVSEKLNLMEKDYFGLRYIDTERQRHWLEPLKTIYKQMKGISPMVLCFRVKFYPEDPVKLREEITRYYLFLQLRRDLHHGRLLCSPDDAVYLAAYIVQSEVGDYHSDDHPPGYISDFKMLPKQTPTLEDQVMEQHRALRGQVPSEAEANFLKRACTLDTYGVDPHQVKDQKGDQLYLGITYQGIMTFRGSRRTQLFKWSQIRRISYEGKMFLVNIAINEKYQPVSYKCQTASAAKYLWRSAVEQQLFFTLATATSAPKVKSGGSLFSRGSRFRFSGRCQNEAIEASQRIHRQQPSFARSSSLPNFAKRHGSNSSRSSAIAIGNRDISLRDSSVLDDSRSDVIWASRKQTEAAVDVPHSLIMLNSSAPYQSLARVESKSIRAPLAPQETYSEDQQQQPPQQRPSQQRPPQQRPQQHQPQQPPQHQPQQHQPRVLTDQPPPRERKADVEVITTTKAVYPAVLPPALWQANGQVMLDTEDILREEEERGGDPSFLSVSYNPNITTYSEDEVEVSENFQQQRIPVQEEILHPSVAPAATHVNHMIASPESADAPSLTPILTSNPTLTPHSNLTPNPTPMPGVTMAASKKRSGGCGACMAVAMSVVMAVVLLALLFYVLYFSGWQHPLLMEARSHLSFLEPARDLVVRHSQELVSFFGK